MIRRTNPIGRKRGRKTSSKKTTILAVADIGRVCMRVEGGIRDDFTISPWQVDLPATWVLAATCPVTPLIGTSSEQTAKHWPKNFLRALSIFGPPVRRNTEKKNDPIHLEGNYEGTNARYPDPGAGSQRVVLCAEGGG